MQEILHTTKADSEDDATLLNGDENLSPIDSSSALQQLLDRIPVSSISGIQSSFDLELKAGDSVKDAIRMLYENDLFGAPMADVLDPDAPRRDFSYRYIGFLDFSTMVLWCIEEFENFTQNVKNNGLLEEKRDNGFLYTLDQVPQIGHTKVGKLAKPYVWEPFFPVHLDHTLLHALLLSKHPIHVLPVIQHPDPQVIGLVTQLPTKFDVK